eukprot:369587-Prymnesium_polylepis.1
MGAHQLDPGKGGDEAVAWPHGEDAAGDAERNRRDDLTSAAVGSGDAAPLRRPLGNQGSADQHTHRTQHTTRRRGGGTHRQRGQHHAEAPPARAAAAPQGREQVAAEPEPKALRLPTCARQQRRPAVHRGRRLLALWLRPANARDADHARQISHRL